MSMITYPLKYLYIYKIDWQNLQTNDTLVNLILYLFSANYHAPKLNQDDERGKQLLPAKTQHDRIVIEGMIAC